MVVEEVILSIIDGLIGDRVSTDVHDFDRDAML